MVRQQLKIGDEFTNWEIIKEVDRKNGRRYWHCKCQCGTKKEIEQSSLITGRSKSCGCLRVGAGKKLKKYHEDHYRKDGVMTTTLKRKNNTNSSTGVKGVSSIKTVSGERFRVDIGINKKSLYLGVFDTLDEAKVVRKKAEIKYHKPYLG